MDATDHFSTDCKSKNSNYRLKFGEAKIIITKCAKVLSNTKNSFYVHTYYIRLDNGENFVYVNVISVECVITCQ